jgi:taurine dioxygenase
MTAGKLDVQKLSAHIGAEVKGIDLSKPIDDALAKALHGAWLEHAVLLFCNQKLQQEDLLRITGYFGNLAKLTRPAKFFPKGYSKLLPNIMMISNIRENGETIGALPDGEMHFHHDQIHSEVPHNGTLLYSLEIPTYGGDTLFANMYAAYEALSAGMKRMIDPLYAVNSSAKADVTRTREDRLKSDGSDKAGKELAAEHPVVRTHPETGRKALYVNFAHTVRFRGMTEQESAPLLNFLFQHQVRPEFTCRFAWQPGSLALWDNRCAQHNPVNDYHGYKRLMHRITLEGDRPR